MSVTTKTGIITAIGRAKNSRNGNARYDLEFDDGSVFRTAADSSYADVIGNPGYREGDLVMVTLTNHKHPKIAQIARTYIEWTPSDLPWDGDVPYDGPLFDAVLKIAGQVRASLGCIAVPDTEDPYCRQIERELIDEVARTS